MRMYRRFPVDSESKKKLSALHDLNVFADEQKGYLARLINLIEDPLKSMRIVVYGQYNHGKSSFLNAWLEKDEFFKVSDKRETVEVQEFEDTEEDITWIDTPGLDADKADTEKAIHAVEDADLLIMVHNTISGELDNNEVKFLKMKSASVDKSFLLLTQIDQQSQEELEQVRAKIQHQIRGLDMRVFSVSSSYYEKYRETGNKLWRDSSGFNELVPVIRKFRNSMEKNRKQEIHTIAKNLEDILRSEVTETEKEIGQIKQKKENESSRIKKQQTELLKRL
ncbi:MAG: hypothetical protein EA349_03725 [Halomonadaceae bacterium]|nr:MAG: hypothetical protein EA349_03725 [Halomonadaceae bacterium]